MWANPLSLALPWAGQLQHANNKVLNIQLNLIAQLLKHLGYLCCFHDMMTHVRSLTVENINKCACARGHDRMRQADTHIHTHTETHTSTRARHTHTQRYDDRLYPGQCIAFTEVCLWGEHILTVLHTLLFDILSIINKGQPTRVFDWDTNPTFRRYWIPATFWWLGRLTANDMQMFPCAWRVSKPQLVYKQTINCSQYIDQLVVQYWLILQLQPLCFRC